MIKYYNVESDKIACWVNGDGFDEQAQNLFFIHGSGGDHSSWSFQYAKLNKYFNVIAVDLPGHGNSEGKGKDDIDEYSRWIKKLFNIPCHPDYWSGKNRTRNVLSRIFYELSY